MLCRLSLGLLASAISVAALPAIAQQEGSADDHEVESVSHLTKSSHKVSKTH
tara:strand:- start:62 stop:217 length:156 start_codon:yes stop_codon:yes gene_type:complete